MDIVETTIIEPTILDKAAECFTSARKNLYAGAALLYQINEQETWKENHRTFGEFVEDRCGISPGMASKLIKAFTYYAIQNNVPVEQLEGVDHEKLYLSINLKDMTPEEKLVRAQTWSRQEMRDELSQLDGHDCEHKETITICTHCRKRCETH